MVFFSLDDAKCLDATIQCMGTWFQASGLRKKEYSRLPVLCSQITLVLNRGEKIAVEFRNLSALEQQRQKVPLSLIKKAVFLLQVNNERMLEMRPSFLMRRFYGDFNLADQEATKLIGTL